MLLHIFTLFLIQVVRPPSPSKAEFDDLDDLVASKQAEQEKQPLINYEVVVDIDPYKSLRLDKQIFKRIFDPLAINPQAWQMNILMGIQTIALLYNAWVIPFGFSFTFYRVSKCNELYCMRISQLCFII